MPDRKKVILITLVDLHFGGISNLILQTTPRLKEYFTVHIVYFGPNEDMLARFKDAGINPTRLSYNGGRDLLKTVWNLRQFIKRNEVDIVSTHFHPDKLIVGLCSLITKFKIVATIHNASTIRYTSLRHKYVRHFHNKIADKVFGVSEAALYYARLLTGLNNPNSVVLYNGVQGFNFNKGINRDAENTVFITACRLNKIKGLERLIDIFKDFNKINTDWTFILLGDGELYKELKIKVNNYGLDNKIIFKGFQQNLEPFYKEADFYINSSINEALSLSIIEAMSIGLPVLASNVGGIPEVVEHNKNGYLIDFQDTETVIKYLSTASKMTPEAYNKFSENSIHIFKKKFSVEIYAKKMKVELEKLLP